MRSITIDGRIAADTVKQLAKSGKSFISFSVANNEFGDPKSEDGVPQTQWFRVTAFEPRLVNLAQYLTKGKPIIVTGRYSNSLWTSQRTGQVNINNEIVATDINFVLGGDKMNGENKVASNPISAIQSAQNVDKVVEDIPQATSRKMGTTTLQPTIVETNNGNVASVSDNDDDLPF